METKAKFLTTTDNPWNPFTNFNEWYIFDITNHYNCCEIVARLSDVSKDMTTLEREAAIVEAIETFVKEDPTKLYTIVEDNEADVPMIAIS